MDAGERSQRAARHVAIQYVSARPDGCFGVDTSRWSAIASASGSTRLNSSRSRFSNACSNPV
jgi:hypothetical protein